MNKFASIEHKHSDHNLKGSPVKFKNSRYSPPFSTKYLIFSSLIKFTNPYPSIHLPIGKGILLKEISDIYKPFVWLKCCSIETNFGNDLESKPFKYDISKHSILKEFY
uniref:Uncharacterized protein n=1 Tax=Meloidogyne enterolobii TaxID=390850 RepID=A0A6V7VLJ8_MELEN|nr:unnamed protein product [Meloidogyne enterolobii]